MDRSLLSPCSDCQGPCYQHWADTEAAARSHSLAFSTLPYLGGDQQGMRRHRSPGSPQGWVIRMQSVNVPNIDWVSVLSQREEP